MNLGLENAPERHGDFFARGNFSRELRDFIIQMTVVHALRHFAIENLLQFLQVENHPRFRIGFAGDRYFQNVIVPMTFRIVAFAEDTPIFLRRQIRIVIKVRGRKFEFSSYADHSVDYGVPTGYSRPFHEIVPRQYFHAEAAATAA